MLLLYESNKKFLFLIDLNTCYFFFTIICIYQRQYYISFYVGMNNKISVILNGKYSCKSTSSKKMWKKYANKCIFILLFSKMKVVWYVLSFCQKSLEKPLKKIYIYNLVKIKFVYLKNTI